MPAGQRRTPVEPPIAPILGRLVREPERRSMIVPYSLRANVVPLVAAPVRWEEVESGGESLLFFPAQELERTERVGDLLEPALGEVQSLPT